MGAPGDPKGPSTAAFAIFTFFDLLEAHRVPKGPQIFFRIFLNFHIFDT